MIKIDNTGCAFIKDNFFITAVYVTNQEFPTKFVSTVKMSDDEIEVLEEYSNHERGGRGSRSGGGGAKDRFGRN